MSSFDNFHLHQLELEKKRQEKEKASMKCPTCSSLWFEEVQVARFKEDHWIAAGQSVPFAVGTQPYKLLKCVRCNDFLEPRMNMDTADYAVAGYAELTDTLQGKGDTRKKDPPNGGNESKG
jgi:hypothetical protein